MSARQEYLDSMEMSETTERPQALTPTDEALLARAQTLREIADAALRDIAQRYPADDHGSVLRDALYIHGLTERLVDQAVVAERERGASWADIGNAANSSRQAAHERWNPTVGAWVLMERRRTGIGCGPADPATHARYLDEWYEDLVGEQRAVSTLLPSLSDEAARAEAEARRAEARHLHDRAEELRKEIDTAYRESMAASGTPTEAEKRAVWAAKAFQRAEVYERLAVIEEPAASEHRRRATTERGIAQDIARNRTPQSPAEGGTREQIYAAYTELTPQERSGSRRAVAALLASRLGLYEANVRKYLDSILKAHQEKENRMTYEAALAAPKIARRAWTCVCGADNPASYDACHDCQHPSWTCASCGTVNAEACSRCRECDNAIPTEALGDEEGFEMTWEEFVALQVGPRRVGGRYDHGDAGSEYEVLAIDHGPRTSWPSWQITVRGADGQVREHCTGWNPDRDRIVAQPPATSTGR